MSLLGLSSWGLSESNTPFRCFCSECCTQRGPVRWVGWVCAQWMKQGTYEYSSSLIHTLPPRTSGARLQAKEGSKEKQRTERENERMGPMKPQEGRGMLYLHLGRASSGVREAPLPSHREPRWHLKTGCSLCATISSAVPVARLTLMPNYGKNHVMWNVSLTVPVTGTSAGPLHRNKANGGGFILCQRGPEGDTSLASAFSILMKNKYRHPKISIEDAILNFLWSWANVQEFVIRIFCLQFTSQFYVNTQNWILYIFCQLP